MRTAHDLTGGDIRLNINRLAFPAAIAFFCHTVYNMTDTFFAGYIGTDAQSALSFSFPIYFILLSCCVGIGQGLTARVGNALGAKKTARAAYYVGQGVVYVMLICVLLWLFLLPAINALVGWMGAAGDARDDATRYSRILFQGAPFFFFSFLFNSALQATGNTAAFRNSVIFSVLLNFILDPMLMFGWFGLPALGVTGIALATVISQGIGAGYMFVVLRRSVIGRRFRTIFLLPRPALLGQIVKQSIAPTGRMLCIGVFFYITTACLGHLDGRAVAAYGIALRIEQLFLLPTIGLEVALLAFAAQNLGAQQRRTTRVAYRLCLRYGFIFIGGGAALLIVGGQWMVGVFTDDPEVVKYGWHYLLVAAAVGPLYVTLNAAMAVLMGALRSSEVAFISIVRLIVLPLILYGLLAFAFNWGIIGIWAGLIICNLWGAWFTHRRCMAVLKIPSPSFNK